VVDAVCWALGERLGGATDRAAARAGSSGTAAAISALGDVASNHTDARCREAAVAALGAIGDPAGLASVVAALDDRAPVRRRAAVALAAFGAEGREALARCLGDRDWQVRQVAETLLGD
jgi:HEAT repeat protein